MNPKQVEIAKHMAAYEEGKPTITDHEFDLLVEQLREEDPEAEVLKTIGTKGKHPHAVPMLSLDKSYSEERTSAWRSTVVGEVVATPKLDGIALSLTYTCGRLTRALTRGDGTHGENVTEHARLFVPERLRDAATVEVRGEAILPVSVTVGTNRRNVMAGLLGKTQPSDDLKKAMFLAYDARGHGAHTYRGLLGHLVRLGFIIPPFSSEWPCSFDFVPFDTDGIVITADNLAERERLGATSHHPRWAIAVKPLDKPVQTTLLAVEWQVSRFGTMTPVAVVAPVRIGGVTVERATLHNADRIRDLGLRLGATVEMTRRGSVIPHIERVIDPGHGPEVEDAPTYCGACGEGKPCRHQAAARLEHFAKVTKVDGVGPEVALAAVDRGAWSIADLYLTSDALPPKIVLKKSMDTATFIEAMGFPGVGESVARKIALIYGDLNDLMAATEDDLIQIGGLGPTTASSLYEGLRSSWAVYALLSIDVTPMRGATSSAMAGKTIVFTGELKRFSRAVAQKYVQDKGGLTPGSVTKKTTHLVVGSNPGADKTAKAAKYGVPLIDEDTFLAMLGPVDAVPRGAVDLVKG